ncbi:hypothetical protein HDA35_005198 [Micromonospora purpureochromogenes]|uniref:Uncharacterized protein n=1 Tax=Micromonospora purpureochromogenes TaxID=47872 RepID=A0ABX2RVK0_9ACTN|nr:hypothetical protein [Micromonospora purpureochromogenes]
MTLPRHDLAPVPAEPSFAWAGPTCSARSIAR